MLRLLAAAVVGLSFLLPAAAQGPDPGAFATTILPEQLDPAATAEWVSGAEQPIVLKNGPRDLIWTKGGRPEWAGVKFGDSTEPGARHLRVGFKEPIACESVLVRGGGRLSVLKADTTYPGKLEDDRQWISAERLSLSAAVVQTGADREDYAVWVLPAGTKTRALRFTHDPAPTSKEFSGWIGGVWILSQRFANLAPQAVASASRNDPKAALINNESDDKRWSAWESVTREQQAAAAQQPPISAERAEWVMLTWPQPVPLRGLCALWAGFGSAEAQIFSGPAAVHPREASPDHWRTVVTSDKLDPLYPLNLAPNWLDFGQTVTTRAVRLRVTATARSNHDHVKNKPLNGRNIWLGELLALRPLEERGALASAILPKESASPQPPIPIAFRLEQPANVTLVIEDADGKRVRNLVADTPYPAGENKAWWDGLDDLGRDPDAARHGLYHVPGKLVAPGKYRVRGIAHGGFDLRYEFPIYTAGNPAWNTADKTGAWLSNHSAPQAALFVPADRSPVQQAVVYLGSYVSEGTHGLAWVNLEGKKLGGMNWVGGNWTGAPFLACDRGETPAKDRTVFTGSVWPVDRNEKPIRLELRLNSITKDGAKEVARVTWATDRGGAKGEDVAADELAGIAAHNGILVASLPRRGLLLFVNAATGATLAEHKVQDPRGLAFDRAGRLLILAGKELRRHTIHGLPAQPALDDATVLVRDLDNPSGITTDAEHIYVTDHGASHQVKVFTADGKPAGVIGQAGAPTAGPYNPLHMNHPAGVTLDDRGRVWVAEHDELPKRVSVWSRDGKLDRAFYGPSEYGGGGRLDSHEAQRFFYGGMEFALDWKQGTFSLQRVYFRPGKDEVGTPKSPHAIRGVPEAPLYIEGRRYFTNGFNSNPTGGPSVAMLWLDADPAKSVRAVAAIGEANDWPLLGTEPFHARWPDGIKPPGDRGKNAATFIWTDLNGDGQLSPEEVVMRAGPCGGVTVMADGSFLLTRLGGETCVQLAPTSWGANGVPSFDFSKAKLLASGVKAPASSGGNQALLHPSGWTFLSNGVEPFHTHSLSGVFQGKPRWSYPSMWPGLHASHEAPIPDHRGQIIGTTRLLGGWVESKGAGPLAFINGNMGPIYVFTADGLFVTQLFEDSRVGTPWGMPRAVRDMSLAGVTTHDENFWPSVSQTPDGKVFLVDGGRSSLVRADGFENLRRLPEMSVTVTEADLRAAQAFQTEREAARQKARGSSTLAVQLRKNAPTVDGALDEWSPAAWAPIDQRGTRAHFNSNSKPYDVQAAVSVADGQIFAAFRTGDPKLLRNSGEDPAALFKTGGALDLMLATDPAAKAGRTQPAAGDLRLLVTMVGNQPRAMLYRAVFPGTKPAERVPFSSPWRTVHFDRVEDVSAQLRFAADKEGNFEFALPLSILGLKATAGQTVQGDLGILRGDGSRTTARVYWNNKATAITADVPSEAQLAPSLWGKFRFEAE